MATIHMLIGIPGAGKSTYCKNVLALKYPNAIIVASDEVRNNNPTMSENEIWPEIFRLCSKALLENKDIIYDATNVTSKVRDNFFNELAKRDVTSYEKRAYYFPPNAKLCKARVAKRNKDVHERYLPIEVIEGYARRIEPPIESENFKEVIIIDNNQDQ